MHHAVVVGEYAVGFIPKKIGYGNHHRGPVVQHPFQGVRFGFRKIQLLSRYQHVVSAVGNLVESLVRHFISLRHTAPHHAVEHHTAVRLAVVAVVSLQPYVFMWHGQLQHYQYGEQ